MQAEPEEYNRKTTAAVIKACTGMLLKKKPEEKMERKKQKATARKNWVGAETIKCHKPTMCFRKTAKGIKPKVYMKSLQ